MALMTIVEAALLQGTGGGAYSSISFGPGEQHVYAINSVTNELTVFDAIKPDEGTVVPDSDGARLLRLLPDSSRLAVLVGDEGLLLVDTSTHTIVEERDFGGNFIFIGDSGDAIALSRNTQSVYLLRGPELQVIRSATGIKNPYQFVLNPN
jgi:DNA-binding beta-propeller fold protein YncE